MAVPPKCDARPPAAPCQRNKVRRQQQPSPLLRASCMHLHHAANLTPNSNTARARPTPHHTHFLATQQEQHACPPLSTTPNLEAQAQDRTWCILSQGIQTIARQPVSIAHAASVSTTDNLQTKCNDTSRMLASTCCNSSVSASHQRKSTPGPHTQTGPTPHSVAQTLHACQCMLSEISPCLHQRLVAA